MASIRYNTGTDFHTYETIWRGITPLHEGISGYNYLEPGFRYFVSFLKMFGDSSVIFFSSMAFLTLTIMYIGLKKIDNINIYVALSIYFMVFYMPYAFNGMRQALAMSIFIFSLTYIINGNFKKTFVLSLIAASFHVSGILILLAYIVSRFKTNLIHYFLVGTILSLLLFHFNIFGQLIDLAFGEMFSRHLVSWGGTSGFQLFMRFVIAIYFIFVSYKVVKTRSFKKIVIIYLLGFFIYIALSDANMMATRFNMFFRVLEVVLFSMILYQSRYLSNRVLFFVFVFAIAIATFYVNISNPDNTYNTFF